MFHSMRVRTRLAIAGFAVLAGLALLVGISVRATSHDAREAHENRIRNVVEVAVGIIDYYYQLEMEGQLSTEEAQKQAITALRKPRYSNNDYFFLYDFDARALMVAGNPGIEGRVMLGSTDKKGYLLWDRFVQIAKGPGHGFVEYWFPRANQTNPKPKLSYVAVASGWKWIVGTGVYIDDIDEAVNTAILNYSLISALILCLTALIGILISRSIVIQLGGEPNDVTEYMKRIANGDLALDIPLKDGDKDSLVASLKLMQMKLVNLTGSIQENATALGGQVQSFEATSTNYADDRSEESFAELNRSVKRIGKTADMLKKSIARFKM